MTLYPPAKTRAIALACAAIGLVTTGVSAEVPAAEMPEGIAHVTSVEGIHEYRLANGLRVLLFPDPSKQTATVNVTYLVGSKHEGYGETGMAHLLEHLVFKGSKNHPNIADELTSHGARPNGSTWVDRTNYFETFAASVENVDWALDMEADRMQRSFISADDLVSEMTVVRNEFELGENQPRRVLEERMYSTAYLWHNYGKSTIGNRSDIEGVPIENLQAFYRKWYRPENAILVVAGKIDPEKTLALVHEKFGALENPTTPLPRTWTEEPAQDGERTVTLRRVGDVAAVALAYHVPSGPHPDNAAAKVLAFIVGDTPSGRLHEALIETKMATSIRANADAFADPGLLYIDAEVRKDRDLASVRDEMIAVVEGVVTSPPTSQEVERAKAALLKSWERTLRNSEWAAIRLSEWASQGDWRLMFLHRDRLKAVTPEAVLALAGTYLEEENRTVGVYVPTDAPSRVSVPATPDIAAMLDGYEGEAALALGEAFDASHENIESRLTRTTLGVGLEVTLLSKQTRGDMVNASLSLHLGNANALRDRGTIAELTGSMLMRGTKNKSRQEIADAFDELNATVSVWGGPTAAGADIETTRDNLPAVLELVTEILREPSFPENELSQLVEREVAQAEEARSDPFAQARMTLSRHVDPWAKSDPRYTPLPGEKIAMLTAVTRGDLVAFHRDVYGASTGEIAMVGDFDADATLARLGELFDGFGSNTPYVRLENPYREVQALAKSVETPDKESAVWNGQILIEMSDRHDDYPAMEIANFMAGGGFLNSRLAVRLRQKDGLSYGAGSRFWASSFDDRASFGTFAIYNPQNDPRVVTAFHEEIERIIESGFTPEELVAAKSGWLQRREVSRGTDRELARTLRDLAHIDRTMAWEADLEAAVRSLSAEEVNAAFRRHVDVAKLCYVRAGDFGYEDGEQASGIAVDAKKPASATVN